MRLRAVTPGFYPIPTYPRPLGNDQSRGGLPPQSTRRRSVVDVAAVDQMHLPPPPDSPAIHLRASSVAEAARSPYGSSSQHPESTVT